MPLSVVGALVYLTLVAGLAAVVGLLTQPWFGWALFSLALLVPWLFHVRNFALLERWSRQPSLNDALEGDGVWDEVFARLYRHERHMQTEIDAARQNTMLLAAAGQALIDGLVSLDASGRIEWCNASAEEMLGLDRRSDVGQTIVNLVRHPDFISYLHQGQFAVPLLMRSPFNAERALSVHVVPYGGQRRLLQLRDVTQSERIDAMRRDFVANVSHELRTPLTVLTGFVETLTDLALDEAERRRYLDLMAEQAARMQRLLEELLVLSNLESSPPPPATERVDMLALCEKLLRDGEALSAGRHRLQLKLEGNGDLRGSEMEIASALSNLVSNAIRYTPEGGQVSLLWRVTPNGAEFAVEDSGIGIDPRHIPRLTERFYRVDRSRSRETGGTGLGLAIVKHALSRHQAILEIRSAPGRGSRFSARFPASRVVA